DEHGEGNHIDYWFEPIKGPQLPVLDGKSETEVLVHEFSASKADNDLISLKFK
ncbi:gametolysin, partial [Limosilactobacillus reuteri]